MVAVKQSQQNNFSSE